MASETYLVTGGCGFIGSHIVEKLRQRYPSARVAVLSRNPTTNTFPGVSYHAGDVMSAEAVAAVFAEVAPTVVFHCAGMMTVGRNAMPDEFVRAINVDGTRHLLDEARRSGAVRAFVTTSSASVAQKVMYRDIHGGDESLPIAEEGDPTMVYPKSKAASDRMTLEYDDDDAAAPGGMRTCTLRPAMVHGERDNDVTPAFMRILEAGRANVQLGDNSNLISATYVGNAADAHLAAADKLLNAPEGVAGEAFFIDNGAPLPFWDFARALWRAAGGDDAVTRPEDVKVVGRTTGLVYAWVAEWVAWFAGRKPAMSRQIVWFTCMSRWFVIDKAVERLGWKPEVEWEEGVRRAAEWYVANKKKREAAKAGGSQ